MKKNILLALLSGSLLAGAWVTYGFTALIFIALVPLLLMELRVRKHYQHTKRKVFALSYLAFWCGMCLLLGGYGILPQWGLSLLFWLIPC